MAWYPGASRMELQPESDAQPAIRPTQFILHSIAAPWTARRTYEFWRDSSSLESHFGLGFEGDLAQYIGTETRADANYQANRRPDGTGAVSIETASNLKHTDPWTDRQMEQLVRLGVWLHQRHGIPLRVCRTAADPGFGYHSLHAAWSVGGTACPGAARIRQFRTELFPEIERRAGATPAEEDDMTPEQARMLAELHRDRKVAPWQYAGQLERGDAWQVLRDAATGAAAAVAGVQELKARIAEVGAPALTDAHVAALADKVASSPSLANRIAELVAEKLAARLAE
ncbi:MULTISPECIES: N-acetylmuramoyl-L-alanine amidase [Streptomyces]|uniref:N-acetylmuramoyl-L-alanine amidase n=1 Tax=Streptomyces changanensis TaxID=2964669 RepID=A0ABY5N5E0_9ACTN|nr:MULTISPECIES: N-acetylmuramoyl-L-alanine amidase [Streptomyces]UUS30821.1 N-acetylmuramoyl-L-alanine amidase [Streptomyces changanensis]